MNVKYRVPSEVDVDAARTRAHRRRSALVATGCQTYELGARAGHLAIVCLCCGLGSSNPQDIANLYCGFCQQFHSEESA